MVDQFIRTGVTQDGSIQRQEWLVDNSPNVVHREAEFKIIEAEISERIGYPKFGGGVINITGVPGIGKSVFINETLLPRWRDRSPGIPVASADFDLTRGDRYDSVHGRAQLAMDLLDGLVSATGRPVVEALKRNRNGTLVAWNLANKILVEQGPIAEQGEYVTQFLEQKLPAVFNEYLFQTADKTRKPVVLTLDSTEWTTDAERKWIQKELIDPTLDVGMAVWVVSGRKPLSMATSRIGENMVEIEFGSFNDAQIGSVANGNKELTGDIATMTAGHPEAVRLLVDSGLRGETLKIKSQSLVSEMLNSDRYLGTLSKDIIKAIVRLSGEDGNFDLNLIGETTQTLGNETLLVANNLKNSGFVVQNGSMFKVAEPLRTLIKTAHINN